jgi:serine/threonine-protein kinase
MKAGEVVAGKYRLDARLGIGGMGEVWKATGASGRELAVKLLHAEVAASPSARQRFAREARISAQINHPNVIDIFDAGEHQDGTLFLAMELLDGISLADAFHLSPSLTVQDLLVVMSDTARALSAAHAVGIVHRDVKPANVFLHRERQTGYASAKILDFGISKLDDDEGAPQTKTGAVLGSPRYMSPEQTRSAASVDSRSDLWACGVILFEGLTGTWPHDGDTVSGLVLAIYTRPPASIDRLAPDLPEPVRSVVRDCLEPPERRIQTADELVARLAVALQDPTLAAIPLARPLHPPSYAVRASAGVRVRPLARAENDRRASPAGTQAAPRPASQEASAMALSELLLGDEEIATRQIPQELVAQVFGRAPRSAPPLPAVPPPAAALPPPPPLAQAAHAAPHWNLPPPRAQAMTVPLDTDPVPAAPAPYPLAPSAAPIRVPPPPAPDSLVGTFESLATTTMREQSERAAPLAPAPSVGPPRPGPAPRAAAGLRFAVAALSVVLLGIIVALVIVVRAGAPGLSAPAATTEPATSSEPPASAPTLGSAPQASASADPPASPATPASVIPPERPRNTRPPPAPRRGTRNR